MKSLMLAATSLVALSPPALAQDREAHRAELLRERAAIDAQLRALDTKADRPTTASDDIVVTGKALALTTQVVGQTATTVDDTDFRNTPATTIADILKLSPGVVAIQGNGPRDIGVSIRGSNARSSFGARNIQVFEDDFPVTQPDGLARFDLADPHAYAAVDVVRGPSSARYGNFALGGAVNFRTRRGRDIQGAEVGTDFGGDGYANVHATIGKAGPGYDVALFGSLVGGDGATGHSGYQTGTLNGLATFAAGPRDRFAVKVIYNEGELRLSTRLSFDQYAANPYQQGCTAAATAAPGCGTILVLANGVNGRRIAQTAAEGDLARNDRRTIVGTRWEHDLDAATTWRTQATFDSRVVDQPTSATPFKGTLDSYNLSTDVTHRGVLAGIPATLFAEVQYDYLDNQSGTFNKTPAGRAGIGAIVQSLSGGNRNLGGRARVELQVTRDVQLVAGVGAERSGLRIDQTGYTYPVGGDAAVSLIPVDRRFWNVAPEVSVTWQAVEAVKLHARLGTGYGLPQATSLFITSAGVMGGNVDLKATRNTGVDLGAELAIGRTLTAGLTGYNEWFRNELVTQSAGVNLLPFTSNAPRSLHRGIEFALGWRPVAGTKLSASYSYNDHHYTDFAERLTGGGTSVVVDRSGNAIPGVIPTFVNVRAGYDRPAGALRGVGGFVEATYRSGYAIDSGNLLYVPAYTLANVNLHYDPPPGDAWWSRISLFASIQNLFDTTYIGSASVIGNSLGADGRQNPAAVLRRVTGSVYAGQPRTVFAGIKSRF